MKERVINFWEAKWRPISAALLALIAWAFIVLPKLGSLVPAPISFEQPAALKITSAQALIDDPFFLPQRLVQTGLVHTHHEKITNLRLVSVAFAAAAAILLYWLLTMWHTKRVAVLTIFLLGTSSWFLHQARIADHNVLYLLVIPALLAGSILLKKKKYDYLWPCTIFVLSLLL